MYGVCLWLFTVISPPFSSGQVNGTSSSRHASATLALSLSLDAPSGQEADELTAFYASVVLGLLGKLLNESSERTLSAIRLSAMKVLPRPPGN